MKFLYRAFKQECPNGIIDEETFKEVYENIFPLGDASKYASLVFKCIDKEDTGTDLRKNQSIKVKELKLESEAGYFSFQGQTFVSTQQAVSEKFLMLANFVDWSQPQGVQRTASKLF